MSVAEPLNVFLLLDTSASMTGAPLEALKQGVSLLHTTFSSRATRPVSLAAIRYDSTANLILPLHAATQPFSLPELDSGGTSALGKALALLKQQVTKKGRTLVYVFTDGEEPTDEWVEALTAVKPRIDKLYGILCRMTTSAEHPRQYADQVLLMRDLTPDALFGTFRTFA